MKPWQIAEAHRIAAKRTQQFMSEAVPTVHLPRSITVAVRKALGLPVSALVEYPLPNGQVARRFERVA